MGTVSRRSTYEVVRTIREALTALRPGLTAETAAVVAPGLRRLLGTPGICLADRTGILASAGPCPHAEALEGWLREVASDGRHRLLTTADLGCVHDEDCTGRVCAAAPIVVDGVVAGALAATSRSPDPIVMRTVRQVAAVLAIPLTRDGGHEGVRAAGQGVGAARRGDVPGAVPAAVADGVRGVARDDRGDAADPADDLAGILPVGAPGRTRFITREQVRWVEADGDYVRLHTAEGETFLARVPISRLERSWSPHGFIRIHRGYLVPFRSGPSGARKRPFGAGTVFRYQGMSTFMGFIRMICPI